MTDIEREILRLQDPETMRLHMGELSRDELLVAQAAVRYALARAQSERVVGVGELEAFIDAMEVSMSVTTANSTAEWESGYRNGVDVTLDELRALIAKAGVGHE